MKKWIMMVLVTFLLAGIGSAFGENTMEYVGIGIVSQIAPKQDKAALVEDPLNIAYISADSPVLYLDKATTFTVVAQGGVAPYSYEMSLFYMEDLASNNGVFVAQSDKNTLTYTRTADQTNRFFLNVTVTDAVGAQLVYQSDVYMAGSDETSYLTVEGKVNAVVSEVITAGMTPYQKAKALHDWLINHAHYSTGSERTEDTNNHTFYPEGVLLNGHGVCESYALAYQMLCRRAGVKCITVRGVAKGEAHMWNQIQLDGDWYMVDCTWDDPYTGGTTAISGKEYDAYFCLTDTEMQEDHTWTGAYPCTATLYGIRHLSENLVETISMQETATIEVGSTLSLVYDLIPAVSRHHALVWLSSDKEIVEVNANGQIGGLKKGTATITCSESDGSHIVTCLVTVSNTNDIPEITPTPTELPVILPEDDLSGRPTMNPETKPTPVPTREPIIASDDFVINDEGVLTKYKGKDANVIIPKGVTGIGEGAFRENTSLTSISIPDSVSFIGPVAFYSCTNLQTVSIPGSVLYIDNDAFSFCTSMSSVNLSEGLQSINSWAFHHCHSLRSIAIPASVTWICPYGAFNDCISLEKITVASGNPEYRAEGNCLITGNTVIKGCKTSVIPNGIKEIGRSAFSEVTGIKSITIPDSVEYIYYDAFSWCRDLETIEFPTKLKELYGSAFHCTKLKSIKLPAGVQIVNGNPFSECDAVTSVSVASGNPYIHVEGNCIIGENGLLISGFNNSVIPTGVKTIGDDAFRSITAIKQISIPEGVTSIGERSFLHCDGLETLTLPNSLRSMGFTAFADCGSLKSLTIPDQITTISEYQFQSCCSLKKLTLPKNLKTIGKYSITGHQLKEVIIPDGTVTIEDGAFMGGIIERIYIPSSVTFIGETPFVVEEIYGKSGSEAENYAKRNGVNFVDADHLPVVTPTIEPADIPEPTSEPIVEDTPEPTSEPIVENTPEPTSEPVEENTPEPTSEHNEEITPEPTSEPTPELTPDPSSPTTGIIPGSDITWNYDVGTKVLTLNGSGAVSYSGEAPWVAFTEYVRKVAVNAGIISLESRTFAAMPALEEVELPDTLTVICSEVFANCPSLRNVIIPDSVANVAPDAFVGHSDQLTLVGGQNAQQLAQNLGVTFESSNPIVVETEYTLKAGKTIQLCPVQEGIEEATFTYTTSDKKTVSVTADGLVKALKTGEATIVITSSHGETAEVKIKVASVKITGVKNSTVKLGYTLKLKPKQSGTEGAKYTYKSSNKKVASVSKKGEVKALKAGKAKITISSSFGEKKEITITVKSVKIKLNKTSVSLAEGKSFTIKASQSGTKGAKYTYKSSNKKVASVSSKGVIKGVKKGTATITVTSSFGETAKIKVTVK